MADDDRYLVRNCRNTPDCYGCQDPACSCGCHDDGQDAQDHYREWNAVGGTAW